jgi:hypothetical protein
MVPQQNAAFSVQATVRLNAKFVMSLAKFVPKGINPQECDQTKLRKPPPVPYIPKKDKVQGEVAKLQNL